MLHSAVFSALVYIPRDITKWGSFAILLTQVQVYLSNSGEISWHDGDVVYSAEVVGVLIIAQWHRTMEQFS